MVENGELLRFLLSEVNLLDVTSLIKLLRYAQNVDYF